MNTEVENRGEIQVKRTFKPILVERVYKNKYQKEGTETAELKQIVETKSSYPTKSVTSSLQENIFDAKQDFNFATTEYENVGTRVAWLDVPEGTPIEQVQERIAKYPEARIMQILSSHPILSDKQKYAVESGLTTVETIAESQVMRYPTGAEKAGQIILDDLGRPIYRGTYFRTTAVKDQDLRSQDEKDFYLSETLQAELSTGGTQVFNT